MKKLLAAAAAASSLVMLAPGQASAEPSPLPVIANIGVDATELVPVCVTITVTVFDNLLIPTRTTCALG